MILALLIAVTAPQAAAAPAPAQSAIDAERAFAADGQKLGQWTAFRKYAAGDAYMFVPQAVNAHAFLQDRKDPPVAVFWWPGRSYVSCDGSYAVNTGPWVREWGRSVGYFTTVWKRQPDGSWKWVYDAGDALPTARAEGGDIRPTVASCAGRPTEPPFPKWRKGFFASPIMSGSGRSPDLTLAWNWMVDPKGARLFVARQWTGRRWRTVIDDRVSAPPKP